MTLRQQNILSWLIPCALSDLYLLVDVWLPIVSKWLGIESVAHVFWICDPLLDFLFDVTFSSIFYNAIFSVSGHLWILALFLLPQPLILVATIVLTIQLFEDPK